MRQNIQKILSPHIFQGARPYQGKSRISYLGSGGPHDLGHQLEELIKFSDQCDTTQVLLSLLPTICTICFQLLPPNSKMGPLTGFSETRGYFYPSLSVIRHGGPAGTGCGTIKIKNRQKGWANIPKNTFAALFRLILRGSEDFGRGLV